MPHTEHKHVIDAVELDTMVMGGIVRSGVRLDTEIQAETSSGEVFPRIQSIVEQKPRASWESRALAAFLQQIGLAGKEIDSLASGLKIYAKKAKHGGTRQTGANHIKYTIRSGIILPRRLSVTHRQSGTIAYDAIVTYDGNNAPILVAYDQSLPAGLTDSERFTLGPIKLSSNTYDGINNLEIDFGITEDPQGADSSVYDTEASISEIKPQVTVRGINPKWFGASRIPIGGLALGHTTATLYLRRRKGQSTFYGDGESQHIKMTVSGLAVIQDVFDANGVATGETSMRFALDYDGTDDPIKFTFDSTIT